MPEPKKIDDERIEVTVVKHKDEILSQLQRQLKLERSIECELARIRGKIAVLKAEAHVLRLTYYEDTGEEVTNEETNGNVK